jgi:GT2 family glycosyltransferase
MESSTVIDGRQLADDTISLAVTTYGTQSLYTHTCLEAIREWKTERHELLVACHDASLLLEYYLRASWKDGFIDRLIFTPSRYGHTKGVNICFAEASGRWLFNVANDIALGPAIVNDCMQRLEGNPQLGLVGWHWYNDGTFWEGGRIVRYLLRDNDRPDLNPGDEKNIRNAPWFTGRAFHGLGGPKWLCLCNTAFFGIRREVWAAIGGFSDVYQHYWADDFLNYAVLDQGLNVEAFAPKYRNEYHFHEIQYSHTDVEDRRRHVDAIAIPPKLEHYLSFLEGGLVQGERQLLYQIARSLPDGSTVLHLGVWRGAGLILFMAALQEAHFIGVDCFDMAAISSYSAQPPVSRTEALSYIEAFVTARHTLELVKANTLELSALPRADAIFVDAGHTKQCIENDVRLVKGAIKPGGVLIFHDYGQPSWPDVKETIDAEFTPKQIRVHGTLCVIHM